MLKKPLSVLSEQYNSFNKIIIALNGNASEYEKYKLIKESDGVVLVGKSGNFVAEDVSKYLPGFGLEDKTYVGFVLIN